MERVDAETAPAAAGGAAERTVSLGDARLSLRAVEGSGEPTVFVHGNPTCSEEWLPFMRRLGGPAIAPDLPGWGRSPLPEGGPATMHELAILLERALDELGVEGHRLVVHDWGALALLGAQRRPERVRRLVIIDGVPLLPGYRWHRIARIWRARGLGELFNLAVSRPGIDLLLREARAGRGPMPRELVDLIWRNYDRSTGRAILALYRSAPPAALEAAGAGLARLGCPALIVWGSRDPYVPPRFGRLYAERLPSATLDELADAGHWPWIDRPEVIDRVLEFLAA